MQDVTQDPAQPEGTPTPRGTPSEGGGSVHVMAAGRRTRLVLSGDVDASLAGELADAVEEAAQAGLPVQIDARHITFMDSSGVAMLARLAHRTPGRVAMIQPPEVVRFLLEVTRIGDVIDVLDTDPGFGDGDLPDGAA